MALLILASLCSRSEENDQGLKLRRKQSGTTNLCGPGRGGAERHILQDGAPLGILLTILGKIGFGV